MIENGTILQDRYLVERQIGAGGMGAVYLAVDKRFENYVAIKETFYQDDEFGEAFEREARLLNSLFHPVLPHVSDYFSENNGHFLVMQYIEGEDLSEIMKREGAFPVKDVLRWTNSLLDALDYLHSQEPPIIHRDIKPQNLKITPRGDIILLDFGLAKINVEGTSGVKSVFGYSRKYSPLEQIQGTGTDERSDIFSLGATVYHLITGKSPIDVLARAAEIVVGNPDPLRPANELNADVSPAVANVLNSALALNSAGRFYTAKAMQKALENAVNLNSTKASEMVAKQQAVAAVPEIVSENKIIDPAKTDDFSALAAFAAEKEKLKFIGDNELPANEASTDENFISDEPKFAETSRIDDQTAFVNGAPTAAASGRNDSRFRFAALAAAAILGIAAVFYFVIKANRSNDADRISTARPAPVSNVEIEPAETVSASIPPEKNESPVEKISNEIKDSPEPGAIKIKKHTVEETKTPEIETVKKSNPPSAEPVASNHNPPAQNKRSAGIPRTQAPQNDASTEPVPDIESIFTGRRREEPIQRNRRENEKGDGWKEKRRKRIEKRRERQNEYPFPF